MVVEAKDFSDEIILLNSCFTSGYHYLVQFGRDEEDNFSFELSSQDGSKPEISKSDFRHITPVGQVKMKALGWRSFFGIPCIIGIETFIAIGVQKIVSHEPLPGYQSRGCYPKSKAFIFKADAKSLNMIVQGLQTLRDKISNELAGAHEPAECFIEKILSIRKVKSAKAHDHQYEEIKTIDWAIKEYQGERLSLFRTLAFSQEELSQSTPTGDTRIVLVPSITNFPEMPPWLEQFEKIFFR